MAQERRQPHPRQGFSFGVTILALAGQAQHVLGLGPRVIEVAHQNVELCAPAVDGHPRLERNARAVDSGLGHVVERDGVTRGEGTGRLVGRLHEVLERLVPDLGLVEVVRQDLVLLAQPVPVQVLDRRGDQAMEALPAPAKE